VPRPASLLPHLLTASRVPLGVALPLLAARPAAYSAVLGVALLTDVVDGRVARRLGVAGPAGARLDSAADAVLYLGAVVGAVLAVPAASRPLVIGAILAVVLLRGSSALVARVRFGRWASIHTWANRIAGGVVVAGVLGLVWAGAAPAVPVLLVAGLAGLAAVEELAITATTRTLDLDRRSLRASGGSLSG
jgi:CDP-diacylglycerol--glycerol-3-phosphate 3-phosphatidyltransferase